MITNLENFILFSFHQIFLLFSVYSSDRYLTATFLLPHLILICRVVWHRIDTHLNFFGAKKKSYI